MSDKVTPHTYEQMNEEFIREGTPFRITPTTQEEIDQRIIRDRACYPKVVHKHMFPDKDG